eukprot:m.537705 g.537705  ORF g.537705 m.537705 type:complete len:344 (+) comp22077_c0_seq28:2678-3709(+)
MTELLLSDVTEKHERLQQAWVIPEQDVIFEEMLASGAFGTVWKGRWGHIPVAVKKLKLPLDGLDPVATEDFDREVSFMQSIRHPNLLIFYGAGVTSDGLAFLVVELMVGGSLRTLLHNLACTLTWEDKFRFALDTARGMKHLHVLNTIHRDLKSDNCLVDEHLRVKIADFGNSRLMRGYREHYAKQSTAPTNNNAHAQTSAVTESVGVTALDMNDYTRATMTKGTGTLLWMAPELFSLGKIQYGTAIDVYSYAVVLFEIWTRQDPWLHIGATDYLEFCTALEKAVLSGYACEGCGRTACVLCAAAASVVLVAVRVVRLVTATCVVFEVDCYDEARDPFVRANE